MKRIAIFGLLCLVSTVAAASSYETCRDQYPINSERSCAQSYNSIAACCRRMYDECKKAKPVNPACVSDFTSCATDNALGYVRCTPSDGGSSTPNAIGEPSDKIVAALVAWELSWLDSHVTASPE